ncbi:hypothetical protein PSWA111526_10235 [Pseudomonas wadenswilerensis]
MHVVRRNKLNRTGALTDRNSDLLTIGQSNNQRRASHWCSHRSGVSDHATFSHTAVRCQSDSRSINGVSNLRNSRGAIYSNFLEVAAGSASDSHANFTGIDVHVVFRCRNSNAAFSLTCSNSDHLTIAQGYLHFGAGRIGQRGGINNRAAFSDRTGSRQLKTGSVISTWTVSNGSHRITRGIQLLVITTGSTGNAVGQVRIGSVHVIRRNKLNRASALTDRNSDLLTIGQGNNQCRASNRRSDRSGVGNHTTFSHTAVRCQSDSRSIDGVSNFGNRRLIADHQVLEVAAIDIVDAHADVAGIDIHIIAWCRHGDAAFSLARRDGDHRAVAQGHGHRGAGRVGQGRGVDDRTAFGHGAGGVQAQAGVIDRVVDGGDRRGRVRNQVLEVATGSARDGGADAAAVVVDVVRRGLHVDGAGGLAGADGDGAAVGQGHGDRRLRRVGQGGGVGDHTAFGDTRVGAQADRGGVDGVGDLGHCRGGVRGDDQARAAGGAGDGRGNLAAVQIHSIVRRDGHADAAGGLPGVDDDDLAIGQGHGQVGQRWLAQGGGVGDHATRFGDRRRGAQGQAGFARRRGGCRVVGIVQAAQFLGGGAGGKADRAGREANGRVDRACGGVEHHEAVATTGRAAATCGRRACCGGFELGGRVSTGGDGLLQLFHRRRSLGGGCRQVSAAVRGLGAPLGVAAQVQGAAVGQLQGDSAGQAGQHLLASEQAVTFDEYTLNPFWGYGDYLANNAFDDGNNTAHWTLRTTRSIWLPCQPALNCRFLMECFNSKFGAFDVNILSITVGY